MKVSSKVQTVSCFLSFYVSSRGRGEIVQTRSRPNCVCIASMHCIAKGNQRSHTKRNNSGQNQGHQHMTQFWPGGHVLYDNTASHNHTFKQPPVLGHRLDHQSTGLRGRSRITSCCVSIMTTTRHDIAGLEVPLTLDGDAVDQRSKVASIAITPLPLQSSELPTSAMELQSVIASVHADASTVASSSPQRHGRG